MASKLADFKTDAHNDWCPGCGDFGIVNSIQMALAEMGLPRHKTALFTGIGCSGKTGRVLTHFVRCRTLCRMECTRKNDVPLCCTAEIIRSFRCLTS